MVILIILNFLNPLLIVILFIVRSNEVRIYVDLLIGSNFTDCAPNKSRDLCINFIYPYLFAIFG